MSETSVMYREYLREHPSKEIPFTVRKPDSFMRQRWRETLDLAESYEWMLQPIAVRQKIPVSRIEFSSRNFQYVDTEGLQCDRSTFEKTWIENDFNVAMLNPDPSTRRQRWIVADYDLDLLPERLEKLTAWFLCMKTPRGYAWPLTISRSDPSKVERLKNLRFGVEYSNLDFREDVMYELIPFSVTCLYDNRRGREVARREKESSHHPDPQSLCYGKRSHRYRMRYWINPRALPGSFSEFYRMVTLK